MLSMAASEWTILDISVWQNEIKHDYLTIKVAISSLVKHERSWSLFKQQNLHKIRTFMIWKRIQKAFQEAIQR